MNLYLLEQTDNRGYDTFDSCVVAARDVESARNIHPQGQQFWGQQNFGTWARSPDKVRVMLIGTAVAGTPEGVILASFNAG